MIKYLFITLILFISILVYFKVAKRFNIIDKPNNRSSHKIITIRGGGIVFPFAMILYALFFYKVSVYLLAGMLLISVISFWDDVKGLPNKIRLLVHFVAVSALLWSVKDLQYWPFWLLPFIYIFIIGTINAYNFMDGINGITGSHSLVILFSLFYLNEKVTFIDPAFIVCPIIACLVFLIFNFQEKAKCFAGDVGSVSISFWIIALLLMAIIKTQSLVFILFLSVYGVDSVLTIIHRLILKQNIFEPHRLHFYQIMANEYKVPHLVVASIYAMIQLIINCLILFSNLDFIPISILAGLPLIVIYISLKPRLMSKLNQN